MSKVTTYYVQNDQIDTLVERFGSQLEGIDIQDKLLLRVILSQYVYGIRYGDCSYTMPHAVLDCNAADSEGNPNYPMVNEENVTEFLTILDGASALTIDGLLEAINSQIRSFR